MDIIFDFFYEPNYYILSKTRSDSKFAIFVPFKHRTFKTMKTVFLIFLKYVDLGRLPRCNRTIDRLMIMNDATKKCHRRGDVELSTASVTALP